jgi:foldase protein PrsA
VSKTVRLTSALGAVLFALVGLSACGGGGVPSNAVVAVNGTPITKTAFKHWLGVAAVSSASSPVAGKPVVPDPPAYTACIAHLEEQGSKEKTHPTGLKKQCELQYKALTQEVLGFLISSEWVIGEAASLGVKVSDKEVRKQFETIKNQQFPKAAEFEKFLASSGQSISDLLLRVKLNLLSTKIQAKILKRKGTVTQAQISKYYNENKSRYGVQEKRDVELILTKSEATAKSAKKEVESGKSFATVAKSVSVDPTSKSNGGLIAGVVKGQEEPALDAVIFSSPAGKLTGPLKTPFGYYVVQVKSITPGSQESLAQATPAIKSQLAATQQQASLGKFVKEFKSKWKAKTDCLAAYVVADCKQFKAPKTGTTSTPTP